MTRTYLQAATVVFTLIGALQLIRFLLGWAVEVNGVQIPVWFSGIVAVVAGAMAVWGVRLMSRPAVAAR